MGQIKHDSFKDEELLERYVALKVKLDWLEECNICSLPDMLHEKRGSCPSRKHCSHDEYVKVWGPYKKRMSTIISRYEEENANKTPEPNIANFMQQQVEILRTLTRTIPAAATGGTTTKLIKQAKVPTWSKGMRIDSYKKALGVWMENNREIPDNVKYQEVLESIKQNKEIEGLAEYLGEHVIEKFRTT